MEKSAIAKLAVLTVAAGLTASVAGAHYLWIETGEKGRAAVFFGEVQEGVKEITGGRLDEIGQPEITHLPQNGGARQLSFEREADRLSVDGVKGGALVVSEKSSAVQDLRPYGIGVVKPMFYARTENAGTAKPQTLDVLPNKEKNKFTVMFKGRPLPKAKVMVYAPNLWMMERVADENGQVNIETPWPGRYVLDVVHKEDAPGTFKETSYEAVRHRATCTLLR